MDKIILKKPYHCMCGEEIKEIDWVVIDCPKCKTVIDFRPHLRKEMDIKNPTNERF